MTSARIRIATRGSRLAQAQSTWVAAALRQRHPGLEVEIRIVRTQGDQLIDAPLADIAGKGAFTKEIERALLDGDADLAVHSLKDLPTEQPEGLRLAASPPREDPHDVLIAPAPLDWKALRGGETIGTSSLRRQAQILHVNPRLTIEPVRGNVPTRIRKALEGRFAAIILAQAGVHRLDLHPPFLQPIDFADMLPAPGQGALGLQVRRDDPETGRYVEALDDRDTTLAVRAEREFLHALGGGCRVPIAALGLVSGERMTLEGMVGSVDGKRFFRDRIEGKSNDPEGLGRALAERLIARGAVEVLREVLAQSAEHTGLPAPPRAHESEGGDAANGAESLEQRSRNPGGNFHHRGTETQRKSSQEATSREESSPKPETLTGIAIIVTRDEDVDGPLSRALLARGAEVVCLPLIEHLPPLNPEPLRDAARELDSFEWIVFTSARGVDAFVSTLAEENLNLRDFTGRIACVGPATARRVEAAGAVVALTPKEAKGEALGEAFNVFVRRGLLRPGSQLLFPRADCGGAAVVDALLEYGVIVHDVEAYRTVPSRRAATQLVRRLEEHTCHVVAFASPSSVDALYDILEPERIAHFASRCAFAAIGPSTGEAFRRRGIDPAVEAKTHTFEGLADAIADHVAAHPKRRRR